MLHLLLLRAHCSFCQIPVLISLACPCSSLSQSLSLSHTQALSLSLDYFQTKIWKHGETRLILDCSLGLYDI
ncbi:unnamed protein product [Brassica rapa]|uniref:Secreted protein n=1 Tax=Brassica campestris TaxID=3711 RepID=A0A8D9CZN2_BRACM|nr:unnamed protein product [Brassica rapa]